MIETASTRADWAWGFADEVWFSRLAQPALAAWAPAKEALHLFEKTRTKEDKAPKALACYGMYLPEAELQREGMLLRFVAGRPVSAVTCAFLEWLVERVTALDKRVLILF